jgi:2',3'-cyclic-nucleotide 2'-phosphodiesterase (5'-nucleotidase family)/predicted AlkP superfamily phosphohydrolase/phosphomutase
VKHRLAVLVAALVIFGSLPSLLASAAPKPKVGKPSADRVIMFASDGMRQDLMERFAAEGAMPTYSSVMAQGVEGLNGLSQAFPGNTGVGWATLATGAYPSEHGSTNNTFHRTGDTFTNSTSGFGTGVLQADTVMQSAERAGKTVVSMEWVASRGLSPALQGPVVDFRTFFSDRGVLLNYDLPGQPAGANEFGVSYQRVDLDEATGWTAVPDSFSPAKQETLKLTNTAFPSTVNQDRFYDLFIYDSTDDGTTNYDSVLVVPQTAGKVGTAGVADLRAGEWADIEVTLLGARAGQTAGFYLKAIDIAPDLSTFRVYFTSVARSNASYNGCGHTPGCAGTFEETLNDRFPTPTAGDFAPLEAGIVDEETYVEQGLMWKDAHWAYLNYIVGELGVKPHLLMLGNPVTDEFQHQFLALVTPTDMDGDPNPYFDDVENDDVADGRVDQRWGFIRDAYNEADGTLALARTLLGEGTAVFASADHGFAPQWLAINARKVLSGATVTADSGTLSVHPSGASATSNCRVVAATEIAKVCWAGGTAQVYVNPTLPAGVTYAEVRTAVVDAFETLEDPDEPGEQVIDEVLLKEELRDVQGSDSLHPNRSGDVVVVARPPYQFDASTAGVAIAPSQFFGQHGFLPELVDIEHNVNMHGTFVADGPGIRKLDEPIAGVRAIDVAPTASFLLGIPGPQSARGKILTQLFTNPGRWKQVSVLDISDYHGQLTPLSERSDTVGPNFAIGGSAFLKPWFDVYRAEAGGQSITVAGGDSVGATPPISAAFGDVPTIELMNLMGFDLDALGNHNFDKGQSYLREELIPLADFSYVSANLIDPATGNPPAEWTRSRVFDLDGFKLAVVGFSNDDLETLIFPGNLDPFEVANSLTAVNAEATKLRSMGLGAVVALGHMGATAGTFNAPTGPGVSLADGIASAGGKRVVDAVIGDHTSFQTISTRPNGVLFVENLSKGVRFTRLRLVVDAATKQVVYKTADWHKPWNIGVTPDAAIQAEIDALNAALAPILGAHVADSTVAVPRADLCGQAEGRTCESLVGDVVTDAMRETYGVDFAITNSGGLRADLTCPTLDNPSDFCPAFTPPPYPITRGQVLGVLPFGNVVSTVQVTGAELKAFLENGVSSMPAVAGRFPQVSGLCFEYDISLSAGNRVVPGSVVRQAADGSCTGAPVDLTAASTYALAINDFMASGGDGYPNVAARSTTRDVMDEVVAQFLADAGTVSPARQDRILCTTTGGAACPVFVP